jgi:hypothetical protein
MQEDLLIGTKEILLGEFDELYPVYGRKWRGELKKMNPWHNTATGLVAWRNISNRTTGNETLRLIVGDMNAVVSGQPTIRKQGLVRPQAAPPAARRKRASKQKENQ